MPGNKIRPLRERFEEKFLPVPWTGCWIWTGGVLKTGYGAIHSGDGRGHIRAHRASWEIYRGPIPSGLLLCHTCDQRLCVNPDHMFLGTHRDNLKDMSRKGRQNKPRSGLPPGVRKRGRRYVAVLTFGRGYRKVLGTFDTPEEAGRAVAAAKQAAFAQEAA